VGDVTQNSKHFPKEKKTTKSSGKWPLLISKLQSLRSLRVMVKKICNLRKKKYTKIL
jgi:hypothetical protein